MLSAMSSFEKYKYFHRRCSLKQQILCYIFIMISSRLKDDGTSLIDGGTFMDLYPSHLELCYILPALASPGPTPCIPFILN